MPQTPEVAGEAEGFQVDPLLVIKSLQGQVTNASLEIAKRDAILEQVQQSFNLLIEGKDQEIQRLKDEVALLTADKNPDSSEEPSNDHG